MGHNRIVYEKLYDAEVEYLEYDGRQYIDTGITPNETIEAEIKIVPTSIKDGSTGLLAARNNPQTASVSLNINSLSLWVNGTKVALNDNNYDSGWVNDAMTYDTSAVLRISNRKLYIDDVLIKSSGKTSVFSFDVSYGLLRCKHINNAWDTRRGSSGRLYYTKIWKDETLVRDFIPVRVGMIGYMYDKVSKKLFANKGTGNFILGQDVANPVPNIRRVFRFGNKRFVMPMPYDSKIEYLKSNGNQYLDIGIIPKSGYRAICVYMPEKSSIDVMALFGQRTSYNSSNMFDVFMAFGTKCQFNAQYAGDKSAQYIDNIPNILHTIELGEKTYLDGNLLKTVTTAFNGVYTISIFAIHQIFQDFINYNDRRMKDCRVYSFKLYNDSDTLIFNGIPVRRGTKGYMYDKVSGRLFGNLGTGNFIIGNDIND